MTSQPTSEEDENRREELAREIERLRALDEGSTTGERPRSTRIDRLIAGASERDDSEAEPVSASIPDAAAVAATTDSTALGIEAGDDTDAEKPAG